MSKYSRRETYYTSKIVTFPNWLCMIMIIGTLILGCALLISVLSDGAADPLKISTISNITFSDDNAKTDNDISLKEIGNNFLSYKDMPYDYKTEVEDTYKTVSGEFVPNEVSKTMSDTYTFTSATYGTSLSDYSPEVIVKFTTDKVKDIQDFKKGDKIKFKGKLVAIGMMNKTKTVEDTKYEYVQYTFIVSDVDTEKGGVK